MKRATIKDIASQLGVSPSTVSRALNDHPDISDKVKEEVRQVAQALNYHVNLTAVNLRNNRSGLIALIIPEITMFFFPSLIKGIEEVVSANGYQLLVLQSQNALAGEVANLRVCADLSIDGILISLSAQTKDLDHLQELEAAAVPIVLFDKSIEQTQFDQVMIDDEEAAYQCVSYLIKAGATKICAVLGDQQLQMSQLRHQGFQRAMVEANLLSNGPNSTYIIHAKSQDQCTSLVIDWLGNYEVDAFFCMSDELSAGVYAAINTTTGDNKHKPKVIGISDGHLPSILSPNLDHYRHSGYELGHLAAERLILRLKAGRKQTIAPETLILEGQLVVG